MCRTAPERRAPTPRGAPERLEPVRISSLIAYLSWGQLSPLGRFYAKYTTWVSRLQPGRVGFAPGAPSGVPTWSAQALACALVGGSWRDRLQGAVCPRCISSRARSYPATSLWPPGIGELMAQPSMLADTAYPHTIWVGRRARSPKIRVDRTNKTRYNFTRPSLVERQALRSVE